MDFEDGVFDKAPTVLVALSQFELAGGKDMRFGVEVEDVSEDGFSWVIRKLNSLVAKNTCTDSYQALGEMMRKTLFTARRLLSLLLVTNRNALWSCEH